jgi:hypothetical protein
LKQFFANKQPRKRYDKEGKMKRKFRFFVFFASVCLPVIAMAQNATYNYARGVDFSPYRTYEWVSIEGVAAPDSHLDEAIKRAIEAQLAAKGLTKSKDGAQLYIAYQVGFPREKVIRQYLGATQAYGPDWPYGRDYGDIYSGSPISTATSSKIQLGNLVLDIYDSSYSDLVWRGNVSRAIGPDNKENDLNKAVAKLLKNYPPKAKKKA